MSMVDMNFTGLRICFDEAHKKAQGTRARVLATFSCVMEKLDAVSLLERAQWSDVPYAFLESRHPSISMFGWGDEVEITAFGANRFTQVQEAWEALLENAVSHGPLGPRLIGGFRFDVNGERDNRWQEFPDARMTLYKSLAVYTPVKSWLLCHCSIGPDADPAALVEDFRRHIGSVYNSTKKPAHSSSEYTLVDTQDDQRWQSKVSSAVEQIRRNLLTKVVLARSVQQIHDEPLNVAALISTLRNGSQAHLFAFRRSNSCFVGATPERLVSVSDGSLHTHALAGTTRRDDSHLIDLQLGAALLDSEKERHEHALVVEAIRDSLAPFVSELVVPEVPRLHYLPKVQHLSTPIHARVKQDVNVLSIVEAMHPTPAVAGHVRDVALDYIRDHEQLDRGWYAAPLGWVDSEGSGDFIVGLRSALVSGVNCYLFAGCGIVSDSDPEQEYLETCLKLSGLQEAIVRSAQPVISEMSA